MTNLPLYSRGNPLKNLIERWRKRTGNEEILVPDTYRWDSDTVPTAVREDNDLYLRTIQYWYFSDIGFDTDDEFIMRFSSIYFANEARFTYMLNSVKERGYNSDSMRRTVGIVRSGSDIDIESGSRHTSRVKGGMDVFTKGVSTTSEQSTSNTGEKLARNTPNETLGVEGTSNVTVTDSGSDSTTYGGTEQVTETPDINKTKTFGSGVDTTETEVRDKLSIDDLKVLQRMNSIYKDFALLFENLFMGVL